MNARGTASVPNGNLRRLDTAEFPKIRDTPQTDTRAAAVTERISAKLAGLRPAAPVWPPKSCPSWCMYADDPHDHLSDIGVERYEDRSHCHGHYQCVPDAPAPGDDDEGEPGTVPLSLEKPWNWGTPKQPQYTHQRLAAELTQHYRSVEAEISLTHIAGYGSSGTRAQLTPGEARELGELLIHLADLAEEG